MNEENVTTVEYYIESNDTGVRITLRQVNMEQEKRRQIEDLMERFIDQIRPLVNDTEQERR